MWRCNANQTNDEGRSQASPLQAIVGVCQGLMFTTPRHAINARRRTPYIREIPIATLKIRLKSRFHIAIPAKARASPQRPPIIVHFLHGLGREFLDRAIELLLQKNISRQATLRRTLVTLRE